MLKAVQIRYDAKGNRFLALQGQSDEEAKEMNRKNLEERDRLAAEIFCKAVG